MKEPTHVVIILIFSALEHLIVQTVGDGYSTHRTQKTYLTQT